MKSIDDRFATSARILAERMEFWAKHRDTLTPIFAAFALRWPEAEFDASTGSSEISISGRAGDLMGAVALLEDWGFHTDKELPTEKVSYWSGNFYRDDAPRIWLYWSSTTCQRVQVGTKMEEVPVYEMRCDEEG